MTRFFIFMISYAEGVFGVKKEKIRIQNYFLQIGRHGYKTFVILRWSPDEVIYL
jgi:hypothetical protein